MANKEGVVLVEQRDIARQPVLEEPLDCVVIFRTEPSEPVTDAARVRVDDEHGPAGGVQEDRVGGLRPHAVQAEQVPPQVLCPPRVEPPVDVAVGPADDVGAHRPEPFRLRAVEARNPDEPTKRFHRGRGDPPGGQQSCGSQVPDC